MVYHRLATTKAGGALLPFPARAIGLALWMAIGGFLVPPNASALPFKKSCESMAAYANYNYRSGWKLVDFENNFEYKTYLEGGKTFETASCDAWSGYAVRKTSRGTEICNASMWYDSGGRAGFAALQSKYLKFFFLRGTCWKK